jgi:arsenate reductase
MKKGVLTRPRIEAVVAVLEDPVADLVRKDSLFEKLGLRAEDYVTPDAVIDLLATQPKLLQRPVVLVDGKAIIGRPKDRVRALLGG